MGQELLLTALDAPADAALLGPVLVQPLAVAGGGLALVGGGGALVAQGAVRRARLALEGRRLLQRGAHAAARAPLHQGLEGPRGEGDRERGRAVRTEAWGGRINLIRMTKLRSVSSLRFYIKTHYAKLTH